MRSLRDIFTTQSLHHAYIVRDHAPCGGEVRAHITKAYPTHEVVHIATDVFGIDESRRVISAASRRATGGRFFILEAHTLTGEAQNALLKVLEEPPPHNHFFICVPHECHLLTTLQSRAHEIRKTDDGAYDARGEEFLALPYPQRIAYLEPIVKEKDIVTARALLRSIEDCARKYDWVARDPASVRHLMHVHEALSQSGAPLKMLLESVALTMPRE